MRTPFCVFHISLLVGFFFNLWRPGWPLFITIALYYQIVGKLRLHRRRK